MIAYYSSLAMVTSAVLLATCALSHAECTCGLGEKWGCVLAV